MKICRICNRRKKGFYKNRRMKSGFDSVCIECRKLEYKTRRPYNIKQCRMYYHGHKQYFAKHNKKYHAEHREERHKQRSIWAASLKLETLTHYGNGTPKCICCSEKIIQFLTLDHIYGGRIEHCKKFRFKKGRGGGVRLYSVLRQLGFPPGLRVMCFNCNTGRSINGGICPHKNKPTKGLPNFPKRISSRKTSSMKTREDVWL